MIQYDSQNVVPGLALPTSPGYLLEMHILKPTLRPTENTMVGPSNLYFNKPRRSFWYTLKFKNHCPRKIRLNYRSNTDVSIWERAKESLKNTGSREFLLYIHSFSGFGMEI